MTERQIENPGEVHRRNIPRSSYMKFHPIWSRRWGETASDGPTEEQMDGWTDRRSGNYILALQGA